MCEERLDVLWYLNCHVQNKFHRMEKLVAKHISIVFEKK